MPSTTSQPENGSNLLKSIYVLIPLATLGIGFFVVIQSVVFQVSSVLWFGVGQGVVAAGIVGLVSAVQFWTEHRIQGSYMKARLVALVKRTGTMSKEFELLNSRIPVHDFVQAAGIQDVYSERLGIVKSQEYVPRQETVSRRVDILGLGLWNFYVDVGPQLKGMAKRGVRIRILVLDPEWDGIAKFRDAEDKQRSGTLASEVIDLTKTIMSYRNPKIQIRWYRATPTINVYRLDDVMFAGPYFVDRPSRNTFTLRLSPQGFLYEQFSQHFESLWNSHSVRPRLVARV